MEPVAVYERLLTRLIRVVKENRKGLLNTLQAAGLGGQHLRTAKHRRSLRMMDLLKILEVLEVAPSEFFRQALPSDPEPASDHEDQRLSLRGALLEELWRELDSAPPGTKKRVTKCVGKSESFLRQIRRGETSVVSGLGELDAILECLDLDWRVFLRQVLANAGLDLRGSVDDAESVRDPVEEFLESAVPPPEEFRIAAEGFDDPIPAEARAELEEIEKLRPEKPGEAARRARELVRSLNLNVSMRAAALWASCLRLEIDIPGARAVVAAGIRIARAAGHGKGEADLLYQMAFIVADGAGNKDGYLTATRIVERAVLEYLDLGDLNKTALAQTAKAVFLRRSGDPKAALGILRGSQHLAQDPLLKAQICGNMALGAIQLRQLSLARQYATNAVQLFAVADAHRQDVGRLLWLQARLESDQTIAESLFLKAFDLLKHLKADCALLILDLARSYLKWHRPADAANAAREAAIMASALMPKSPLVEAIVHQLISTAEAGRVSTKLLAVARRIIRESMAARTARRLDRPR